MGQSQSSDSPPGAAPCLATSPLREDENLDPRSPLPQAHRMSVAMRKQTLHARDAVHDDGGGGNLDS